MGQLHEIPIMDFSCEWVSGQNKNVIMTQPPYSQGLAPADFFLFSKLTTPIKEKRFATIEQIKDKAVGGTIKRVSEVFQGLEKTLA